MREKPDVLDTDRELEIRYRQGDCWRRKTDECPGSLMLVACGSSDVFPGLLYCTICGDWKRVPTVRDGDGRIALSTDSGVKTDVRRKADGFGSAIAEIRQCVESRR